MRLIEWYRNRWECVDNGIDIPLLDWMACLGMTPFAVVGAILLLCTAPIWGIPYAIYQIKKG